MEPDLPCGTSPGGDDGCEDVCDDKFGGVVVAEDIDAGVTCCVLCRLVNGVEGALMQMRWCGAF